MNWKHIAHASAILTLIFAFGLTTGCYHQHVKQGADIHILESVHIVKGKTTKQELMDQLGPPMSTTARGDGTEMLSWTGVEGEGKSNMTGAFIPFAPVHVHVNSHSVSLQVTVKDGVIVDYNLASSNTEPTNY